MEQISYDDFKKLDIRIARIKEVIDHPNAERLYILKIDLGGEEKEIVAGIKPYTKKEELVNKEIVVITNLESRNIRGIESNGMLLAAQDEGKVVLLTTDKEVKPGSMVR